MARAAAETNNVFNDDTYVHTYEIRQKMEKYIKILVFIFLIVLLFIPFDFYLSYDLNKQFNQFKSSSVNNTKIIQNKLNGLINDFEEIKINCKEEKLDKIEQSLTTILNNEKNQDIQREQEIENYQTINFRHIVIFIIGTIIISILTIHFGKILHKINKSKKVKRIYTWKLDNIKEKRKKAKNNKHDEINSPQFVTSDNQYKLRLVVYPNGYKNHINTHFCMYLQILDSPNNHTLPWPCRDNISFALLDSEDKEVLSETYDYDENVNQQMFRCPQKNQNKECSYGPHLSIEWKDLKEHNKLINNGSIYIQIKF